MTYTTLENNQVTITGEVIGGFEFSHEVYGEQFFLTDISVKRHSDVCDVIPVLISERLLDVTRDYRDFVLAVNGQFRSFNKHTDEKNHLLLSVFAKEIEVLDKEKVFDYPNGITIRGYICKEPKYRKTPLGREITDILVAVNRPYGKSDYIPCICWGRNAHFAEQFEVGAHIQLEGRIQSREYQKKLSEEEYETKAAYEVSVSKLEYIEQD